MAGEAEQMPGVVGELVEMAVGAKDRARDLVKTDEVQNQRATKSVPLNHASESSTEWAGFRPASARGAAMLDS